MKKSAQAIKHDLLNMFTVISNLLKEKRINRKKLLEITETSALLIKHQEIFMKKKPQFFYQKISLRELLETALATLDENENQIKQIQLPSEKVVLRLDRFYISEAVKQLLKRILKYSQRLQIRYHSASRILQIDHASPQALLNSANKNHEVGLELGLAILRLSKIRVKEKKGQILLTFPVESSSFENISPSSHGTNQLRFKPTIQL